MNLNSLYRFKYFLNHGTLHGVRFLGDRCRGVCGKLTWVVILAISAWIMSIIFIQTIDNFQTDAITINPDNFYLDWNNTFPAVSLCFAKGRSTTMLKNYLTEYWQTNNLTAPKKVMSYVKMIQSYLFINPNEMIGVEDEYCAQQNKTCGVNLDTLREIFFPKHCSMFISDVTFLGKRRKCGKIFKRLQTEMGTCFTANSIHTYKAGDVNKLPLRYSSRSNEDRQLTFKYLDLEVIALQLYVHSPEELPYFQSVYFPLRKSVYTYLAYDTTEIINSPEVQEEAIAKRKCRFPDEKRPGCSQPYSFSSCFLCLRIQVEMDSCNCTIPTAPIEYKEQYCDYKGLKCIKDTNVNTLTQDLHYQPDSACEQSCVEMEIKTVAELEETTSGDLGTVLVDIINVPSLRYVRNVARTYLDLVVSIGGVAGLFFGASLLSIVEIVYIYFIRQV